MEKEIVLTEEQKANIEKIDAILADEKNRERIKAMTSDDEVFAFFEENGFSFTEEERQQIKAFAEKAAEKYANVELTEEELEQVAGGWSLGWFLKAGLPAGTFGVGTGAFGIFCATVGATGPIGWVVGGVCIVAGIGLGVLSGFADEY